MMLVIPGVLDAPALAELRALLEAPGAEWVDGRATAGHQGAPVKANQQIDERSATAARGQAIVAAALERHPTFISAALPNVLYPPLFNRYAGGMAFGPHVDGGVRLHPRDGRKLRTDLSATLFLADPGSYDGGELVVDGPSGTSSVRSSASAGAASTPGMTSIMFRTGSSGRPWPCVPGREPHGRRRTGSARRSSCGR